MLFLPAATSPRRVREAERNAPMKSGDGVFRPASHTRLGC
jgi:hypothetical protein